MAVKIFVYSLLVISFISTILSFDVKQNQNSSVEKPMITFENPTLYTINSDNIERIVNSKQVLRYKDRDVMYDGKFILRNSNNADYIQANVIVKRDENYKFLNNVSLNREGSINFKTDELFYNAQTKIATNTLPFKGNYFKNFISGENLYFDTNKNILKAKKSHFEIEIKDN